MQTRQSFWYFWSRNKSIDDSVDGEVCVLFVCVHREGGGREEVGGRRWEERGMVITYSKENVISLSLLSSLSKHD